MPVPAPVRARASRRALVLLSLLAVALGVRGELLAQGPAPIVDIVVRVVAPDGAPVPGVTVTLGTVFPDPVTEFLPLANAPTDDDGRARVSADRERGAHLGLFVLKAERPDGTIEIDAAPVFPLPRVQQRRIAIGVRDPGAVLTFLTPAGEPAADLPVRVPIGSLSRGVQLSGEEVFIEEVMRTDAAGRLELPWAPDPHRIRGPLLAGDTERGFIVRVAGQLESPTLTLFPFDEVGARRVECVNERSGAGVAGVRILDRWGRCVGVTNASGSLEELPAYCRDGTKVGLFGAHVAYRGSRLETVGDTIRMQIRPHSARTIEVCWEDGTRYLGPVGLTDVVTGRRQRLFDGERWWMTSVGGEPDRTLREFVGTLSPALRPDLFQPEESQRIPDASGEVHSTSPVVLRGLQVDHRIRLTDSSGCDLPFVEITVVGESPSRSFQRFRTDADSILRLPATVPAASDLRFTDPTGTVEHVPVLLEGAAEAEGAHGDRATRVIVPRGASTLDLASTRGTLRVRAGECGALPDLRLEWQLDHRKSVREGTRTEDGALEFVDVPCGAHLQLRHDGDPGPFGSTRHRQSLRVAPLAPGETREMAYDGACEPGAVRAIARTPEGAPVPDLSFTLTRSRTGRVARSRPGDAAESRRPTETWISGRTGSDGTILFDHLPEQGTFTLAPEPDPTALLLDGHSEEKLAAILVDYPPDGSQGDRATGQEPRLFGGHLPRVTFTDARPARVRQGPRGRREPSIPEFTWTRYTLTSLRGEVRLPDGTPCAGARVTLDAPGFAPHESIADASGRVRFDAVVVEAPVRLSVIPPEDGPPTYFLQKWYASPSELPWDHVSGGTDSDGQTAAMVVVRRGPVARFRPDPLPADRTPVRVIEQGRRGESIATGTWQGDVLEVAFPWRFFHWRGTFRPETLRLVQDTWISEPIELALEDEVIVERAVATMAREERTFRVTLVNENEAPVVGAPLIVVPPFVHPIFADGLPQIVTGPDGVAVVRARTPLAYLAIGDLPGYTRSFIDLRSREADGGDIRFVLEPVVEFRLDLAETPFAGANDLNVAILQPNALDAPNRRTARWSPIEGKTILSFDACEAGEYELVVMRGRREVYREGLGYLAGPVEKRLELPEPCSFVGVVSRDGSPVGGGRVQLLIERPDRKIEVLADVDAQGRYALSAYFEGAAVIRYFEPWEGGEPLPTRFRKRSIELTPGEWSLDLDLEERGSDED